MNSAKLLLVGGDPSQIAPLCAALEPMGHTITCLASATAALVLLRGQAIDLVLTELILPEMDGIAFLSAAKAIDPEIVVIVVAREGTIATAVQAMQAGAMDYIPGPWTCSTILPVLARALDIRSMRRENIDLQQLAGIYELSMAIRTTLDLDTILNKVADVAMAHSQVCGVSVLLPTEDGKSLRVAVTRGVHSSDEQKEPIPFIPNLARWIENSLELRSHPDELSHVQASLPLQLPEMTGDISFPMLAGGSFIGILNLSALHPGRPASPGHIKGLNILAGIAALAIESASLLEKLQTGEQRYRRMSENADDIIFRYELLPQTRFTYMNPASLSIVGYSPKEYYADPDLVLSTVHPDDRHLMEAVLHGNCVSGSTVTLRWIHRSGNAIWMELRNTLIRESGGELSAIECIGRDVSGRKQLEGQLYHSQKMEAIGLLAGGVAHDFNNLLTVIIGYSDLIVSDDEPGVSIVEKVAQVKKAAEQAADLTGRLLAFGRRQLVQPTVLDVNKIVQNSSKMLRRIIGEDIQLVTALDAELAPIKADAAQIEQILLNLAVNAKAAMPQGGKITLETKNVSRDAAGSVRAADNDSITHIMVAVSDTGCGMDTATQARIFEPFFTTKSLGLGTGLGLSIVYGIVKQSAGHIRVSSQPGLGARFEILIPRSEEREESLPPSALPLETLTGCETILVVEDDPGVRQLISAVLHNRGYETLIASGGSDAIRICQQHEGRIALILTDLIMPEMNGAELVTSLRISNPFIRVLFMSGYAGENGNSRITPGMPFIQKPFSAVKLIGKIRELLDNSASQHA